MRKEYDNGYYEGDWVDGKRNGLGTLYYNDARINTVIGKTMNSYYTLIKK